MCVECDEDEASAKVYCSVKVQSEALAESSVVFGRVFGYKMGRRLTVVEEGLFMA